MKTEKINAMDHPESAMARKIGEAVNAFEQRTGSHQHKTISVILSGQTMVITLHGALSPIEHTLAQSPIGADQLQKFHRRLFAGGSDSLREEIREITGVKVCEAITDVEPSTGTVSMVSTSGAVVHVVLLDGDVPAGTWSGNGPCNESPIVENL
ncbi:MAG: DUF2294 family protein [Planctomycetes bacterium]|nr:DUF2294 family protein [Planctomycetota bacterium]